MDLGIEGKVAMVAAASKGIGLAIAQELDREGCVVSICARTQSGIDDALATMSPRAKGFAVDVTCPEDMARWLDKTINALASPDIVVTNTGGPPAGPVFSLNDDQWQAGFESTLMNVVRLTRLVVPGLMEKRWGRIVHITSLVAKDASSALPISSTLRSGIGALTKLQAVELASHGITVNAVLPGHTDTDRQRHLIELRAKHEGLSEDEARGRQLASLPIGRFAHAEEIAAATAFLCSERASYITGISLLVDGGATKSL